MKVHVKFTETVTFESHISSAETVTIESSLTRRQSQRILFELELEKMCQNLSLDFRFSCDYLLV